MRDSMNFINPVRVLSPSAGPADNTAQVGAIVDSQGYDSLTYIIETGTLVDADATFAVTLDHGDAANLSDAAAVTSADLIGTLALAGFVFSDDNKCFKVGYRGTKRYTRLTITPSANASAAPMAAIAVLGHATQQPTANPPV